MNNRGVFIVCGGTGGHLAPGIATAQRLMDAGIPVLLGVSQKEVDAKLIAAYPEIRYRKFHAYPFSLSPIKLLRCMIWTLTGLGGAVAFLSHNRPQVVLAFGGYVSVHFGLAARLLGIPLVLHEANRKVGRSIRLLAEFANDVFVPDGVVLKGINPRRVRYLGMPLRREIVHLRKDVVRRKMDMPLHSKVLVVVGGSQGAAILNEWVEAHWSALSANRISVIVVTGRSKQGNLMDQVREHGDGSRSVLHVIEFSDEMNELLSCADLVIGRAGAGTIAELVECLTPSILIPYPHAADDHQSANARYLERRGGCILLSQDSIAQLYAEVGDLIYSDWMLDRIRINLKRMAKACAADELAGFIRKTYLTEVTNEPA